jgi:hypothetical protein
MEFLTHFHIPLTYALPHRSGCAQDNKGLRRALLPRTAYTGNPLSPPGCGELPREGWKFAKYYGAFC